MLRRLLNIASIVCLVLCVALMGMWVRSYWRYDVFNTGFSGARNFVIHNCDGHVRVSRLRQSHLNWAFGSMPEHDFQLMVDSHVGEMLVSPGIVEFRSIANPYLDSWTIYVPHFFLVLTTGSLAMACQLRWPWRFTLRSLFIATTFLAVVLGMILWLDHAWIRR
jgi:hypothetical protein